MSTVSLPSYLFLLFRLLPIVHDQEGLPPATIDFENVSFTYVQLTHDDIAEDIPSIRQSTCLHAFQLKTVHFLSDCLLLMQPCFISCLQIRLWSSHFQRSYLQHSCRCQSRVCRPKRLWVRCKPRRLLSGLHIAVSVVCELKVGLCVRKVVVDHVNERLLLFSTSHIVRVHLLLDAVSPRLLG